MSVRDWTRLDSREYAIGVSISSIAVDDLLREEPSDPVGSAILDPQDEPEDPVRLRGSLVAMRWAFGEEACRMAERVREILSASSEYVVPRDVVEAHSACVRHALEHDRRFELSVDDIEFTYALGGAFAVYELWTGETALRPVTVPDATRGIRDEMERVVGFAPGAAAFLELIVAPSSHDPR